MEEGGIQAMAAAAGGASASSAGGMMAVRCRQCTTVNQVPGRRSGDVAVCCYVCGFTQRVRGPGPAAHASSPRRPARHAPPPRVICGADAPELLIKTGAEEEEDVHADAGAKEVSSGSASNFKGGARADEFGAHLSEGLLGGGSSGGFGSSIIQGKASKSWAKSMSMGSSLLASSTAGGSGSSLRLGDGIPESEYNAMGDEAGALFGGPPKASSKKPLTGLGWSRSRKRQDVEESLLERVRVDGEWELIRPPAERPYWYNSTTQVSQWEPPAVVRQGNG